MKLTIKSFSNSNSFPETENYLEKWNDISIKNKNSSLLVTILKKIYLFNKKYFIKIWACLFIIVAFLNLIYLQPIKWSEFYSIFNRQFSDKKIWIFVLIYGASFFIMSDLFLAKLSFSGRISSAGEKKISSIEWFKFHSISFLIRSVTPFSIGSEPYVIWWLKKRGIPTGRGAAIVSSLTISWFLAQGLITWPSFIYIHIQGNWSTNSEDLKYYWLMVIGLLVDLISTIFVFSISFSKKINYFFAITKYKLNSWLKLENSRTVFDIKWKYLNNKQFKKNFIRAFFNILTIRVIIVFTIQNILNYSLFALIYSSISENWGNFFNNLHIINISTTSNNFLPTPGSEGSIQLTIEKISSLISAGNNNLFPVRNEEEVSKNLRESIFLWRWFQKYQPFILVSIILFFHYLYLWSKEKIKKCHSRKDTFPELTSWYIVNNSLIS